jgi:DNA-binding FadR family transcriptional regulator
MLAAEWILEQIRSQVYPEGTKLPSERDIAQTLGMSRPPVREALSALQIARIVEIRPGDGTYVKSATPANEFHLAVASATQNSILQGLLNSLLISEEKKLWQESIQRYLTDPDHIKTYVGRHQRLLQAIKARDADLAVREMREHFSETVEEVRDYL